MAEQFVVRHQWPPPRSQVSRLVKWIAYGYSFSRSLSRQTTIRRHQWRTIAGYGTGIEEINGDLFFRAANPPYGATISYYLRDASGSEVKIAVADKSGAVVRTLTGPGSAGLHHVQWDLETDTAKTQLQQTGSSGSGGGDRSAVTLSERQRRRRVSPGEYPVALTAGDATLRKTVLVKAESDGVRSVLPRK